MPGIRLAIGIVATLVLVGCGSAGAGVTPPVVVAPATTTVPARPSSTTRPSVAPAPPPTVPAPPTAAPTPTGPEVLASNLSPYRITVPAGPTTFIPAPAPWDGVQILGTDTRVVDRA